VMERNAITSGSYPLSEEVVAVQVTKHDAESMRNVTKSSAHCGTIF